MFFKKLFLYSVLFGFSSYSIAQIHWQDHFNNSNLNWPQKWLGDTSSFIIDTSGKLRLQANPSSSPIAISTESKVSLRASWEFFVQYDFSPSTSNYSEVYLIADHIDPQRTTNACFVRIGGSSGSSDDVSLYVKKNGQTTEIIDGRDGVVGGSTVQLYIKVERDSNFNWSLYTDTSLAGSYELEGYAIDSSVLESYYFSLNCRFTSSRSDKFYFDDFSVSGYDFKDEVPIRLLKLETIDSNSLQLTFSEPPSPQTSLNKKNYRLLRVDSFPEIIHYTAIDSTQLIIKFQESFQSGLRLKLIIDSISDQSENYMLRDTVDFLYFTTVEAKPFDVLITEWLADPFPTVGLPDAEFAEIFNRSEKFIDLENWILKDASGGGLIPSYILYPNEYLILCNPSDSGLLSGFGQTLGVEYFPSLNNSGDKIQLLNSKREPIDKLEYDLNWYGDPNKTDGGWSIELINPYKACMNQDNYAASNSMIGGSPGLQNSIYDTTADLSAPILINYYFHNNSLIELSFDEVLDSLSLSSLQIMFDGISSHSFKTSKDGKGLFVELQPPLDSGRFYTLSIFGLKDCEGNSLDDFHTDIILFAKAKKGDVVINEILFNPFKGGSDFIELLNISDKVFSLDEWMITNADRSKFYTISTSKQHLKPWEYWVLTEDSIHLLDLYHVWKPEQIIQIDLPSFNDDEGSIYLFQEDSLEVDGFSYQENMHFDLLLTKEGVSLERIDPMEPSIAQNFFSASETSGFASPTAKNSQYSQAGSSNNTFNLRSDVFSPDNDGYEDLLFIDYHFKEGGHVGSISILDAKGREIKKLINNQHFAKNGNIFWDGLNDQHSKAPIGIYLLYIHTFHLSGKQIMEKIPFVLAGHIE